jgi:hypothetical protein
MGGKDAGSDAPVDAPSDVVEDYALPPVPDGALAAHPCSLPGTVQFTTSGKTTIPGAPPDWPDLGFLHLPAGFCAHYYANVGNARQMRFAPGGELFVASPTAATTGGGANGQSAYVVVPDYNMDGIGDSTFTYVSFASGSMNQGMLFTGGYFYYQDGTPPGTKIMRLPYASGDLKPSGTAQQVRTSTSTRRAFTGRRSWTSRTTGASTSATAGTRARRASSRTRSTAAS